MIAEMGSLIIGHWTTGDRISSFVSHSFLLWIACSLICSIFYVWLIKTTSVARLRDISWATLKYNIISCYNNVTNTIHSCCSYGGDVCIFFISNKLAEGLAPFGTKIFAGKFMDNFKSNCTCIYRLNTVKSVIHICICFSYIAGRKLMYCYC